MPRLDRGGVTLHYEVHGPADGRADAPVLLLTHGYSATAEMWRGNIAALSGQHRLILWDMRGHGQSDSPADQALYSEAHTVADMAALLDAVGARKAIIGGLSLGGYMSLAFHASHPERCAALLIIDTGPGFKKDEARADWNKRAGETADRFEREGLAALSGGSAERRLGTHRGAQGLARAARGMLAQADDRVMQSLPTIKVPALVVVGSEDKPFLAASDYMAAKIPGAKKAVIDGAGHAANIDRPKEFDKAITEFLDGLKQA